MDITMSSEERPEPAEAAIVCPDCSARVPVPFDRRSAPSGQIMEEHRDSCIARAVLVGSRLPPTPTDYATREEAIIASLHKFLTEQPKVPLCGWSWRHAFQAGEDYAKARAGLGPPSGLAESSAREDHLRGQVAWTSDHLAGWDAACAWFREHLDGS